MVTGERSTAWLDAFLPTIGPGGVLSECFQLLRFSDIPPLFVFGADLPIPLRGRLGEGSDRLPACGVSPDRTRALAAAVAEGIERYSFATWQPEVSSSLPTRPSRPPGGRRARRAPLTVPGLRRRPRAT